MLRTGQDWFVENVLELLDSPHEHYIDPETRTLYFQPNSTGTAPPDASLELAVPTLRKPPRSLASGSQTLSDPLVVWHLCPSSSLESASNIIPW